jgi:ribose transport system permease protein
MAEAIALAPPRVRLKKIRAPGTWAILGGLLIAFSALSPNFLAPGNLTNIGLQSAILLLLALPMTLIILTEGLDLSMGALMALVSMTVALLSAQGLPVSVAVLGGLAVGTVGGIVNGVLIATFDIPPFIATIGTLGMYQGLALVLTDGQSVVDMSPAIPAFFSARLLGIPSALIVAAAAYGVFHYVLYHTGIGTSVFALGGNRDAWKLAGGSVTKSLIAVYAIGGLMVGIAGFLFTARASAGHPTASLGMEFDAIAAVALGGTSFEKGNGWLFGTVLGVLAIGVLRNGLNLLGYPSSVQVVSVGVLVILALFLDGIRAKA